MSQGVIPNLVANSIPFGFTPERRANIVSVATPRLYFESGLSGHPAKPVCGCPPLAISGSSVSCVKQWLSQALVG